MGRIVLTSTVMRRALPTLLLLTVLILALGGCGGDSGDSSSETPVEKETPAEEETTAGGTTTTAPSVVEEGTTFPLTPSRDSGVSGTATFVETSSGVEVRLDMRNLTDQPGTAYPAHIHEGGTCADERAGNSAPIEVPLNPVVAEGDGTASSTTVIEDVTLEELRELAFAGPPRYIDVHAPQVGGEAPLSISCADLVPTG